MRIKKLLNIFDISRINIIFQFKNNPDKMTKQVNFIDDDIYEEFFEAIKTMELSINSLKKLANDAGVQSQIVDDYLSIMQARITRMKKLNKQIKQI